MNPAKSKGFTFVEMMLVVGIIALLAAIAIPNLLRAKIDANQSAAKGTLKSISNALENYYAINNRYPPDTDALIGTTPPYLNKDYFNGTHQGYTYVGVLADYSYTVTATPSSGQTGTVTYTITTGGVLSP